MINAVRPASTVAAGVLIALSPFPPACWAEAQGSAQQSLASSPSTTSTSHDTALSTFSLTISPTRLVVGQASIGVTQRVKVANSGTSPLKVTVQKKNFHGGSDGSLVFQDDAPYSASNWVTVNPVSFQVAAGATRVVTANVSIPANPEPGDHQVALIFLVPAGKAKGNIKVNRGIGTPVYITVPGPTDNSVSLSDLHAPGFATGGPVTITAKVHDTGTVHRDFRGATQLKVRAAGAAAAFPNFTVLRSSTRNISTTWNPPLMCICHPRVSIVNANKTIQSMSTRVIVFPLPQLGIAVGALLGLVLIIYLMRRRYQTSVISAAERLNRPADSGDA
jgi:hypothetical protein